MATAMTAAEIAEARRKETAGLCRTAGCESPGVTVLRHCTEHRGEGEALNGSPARQHRPLQYPSWRY